MLTTDSYPKENAKELVPKGMDYLNIAITE